MQLRIEVDNQVRQALQKLMNESLPEARRQMVEEAARETLQAIIEKNPVDTGRSRAAWANALGHLDGQPPAGWEGGNRSGTATGRNEGSSSRDDTADATTISAHNEVPYIHYLEYGTSRMAPFAMVRNALLRISRRVNALFQLR